MATRAHRPQNRKGMQLSLLLGALLCFAMLAARYFAEATNPNPKRRPKTWTNRVQLAKLLVGAAMALYAISTTLNGLGKNLAP